MEEKNISQFEVVAETEHCVLCGRDTGIPVSEPVEGRKNYVYGCGQLCGKCFASLGHDPYYFD